MGYDELLANRGRRVGAGIWRLADPKISLASFASLALGGAAAASAGSFHAGWYALTVAGIFCVEVAKNASGELVDFDSGTDQAVDAADRSPFSGGKRVLVEGLLTRAQTRMVSLVAYALAIACGIVIAVAREPAILGLAIAGVLLAYFYHGAPPRLSYRGLGELAVGLAYGPMICAGTYLVQAGSVPLPVALIALPLGLLVAAFLWINEFPDYRADERAHKRTLVVRLGRPAASRAYAAIVALAFVILALLPLVGLPGTVWLGAVGLLPGFRSTAILLRDPEDTPRIIPAQGLALLAFVLYAAGAAAGLLIRRG